MHARNSQKKEQGFTLIELLIVIGIIGFLAAAVLVAVDPVKRIQDSRDARRFSEANAILNAVLNKQVDDRRIYNATSDAPIITSATNAQVIVTSDTGIDCDTATAAFTTESYPGCGKTLDNTARTIAGSITNTGAVLNGFTAALTEVRVGDILYDATTDGLSPCTVKIVNSNTQVTCTATPSPALAGDTLVAHSKKCVVDLSDTFTLVGTVSSTGTSLDGQSTSTNFSAQLSVGDVVSDGTNTCTVASITDADTATCVAAPTPGAFSADTLTVTQNNPLVPNYIASAPIDPRGSGSAICQTGCTTNGLGITTLGTTQTGYYLQRSTGNRIEIGACSGEQTTSISVKR